MTLGGRLGRTAANRHVWRGLGFYPATDREEFVQFCVDRLLCNHLFVIQDNGRTNDRIARDRNYPSHFFQGIADSCAASRIFFHQKAFNPHSAGYRMSDSVIWQSHVTLSLVLLIEATRACMSYAGTSCRICPDRIFQNSIASLPKAQNSPSGESVFGNF